MSIFALRSNGLASSAYKNLSRTQSSLNSNIGRLSSGLRIGSAADDSAGSNASVRMSNQVRGMSQANRNTQEANNLLATAESGLSDISDILSKMRELSVQAATDTLNDNDRSSIDLEFQSLKDELTRIANVTEYNGMNVLNGTYQEGGGSGPASLFNANSSSSNPGALDYYDQYQPGTDGHSDPHGTNGPGWVNENGPGDDIRGHWRLQIGADNDINNQHEFSVMNATAKGLDLHVDEVSYASFNEFKTAIDNGSLNLYVDTTNGVIGGGPGANKEKIVYDATLNSNAGGIKTETGGTEIADVGRHKTNYNWVAEGIGTTAVVSADHDSIGANAARFVGVGYYDANVGSVNAARSAVTSLDAAIDEINRERSYVGSEQNKLQFTMSNLSNNIQNIEASRSSIEDADFAAEAADLAKNQILAQSATAMLAQAAMISQNFLGLLA